MRNVNFQTLILGCVAMVLAIVLMHGSVKNDVTKPAIEQTQPVKTTMPESSVDDWVVKPAAYKLVSTPIDEAKASWNATDDLPTGKNDESRLAAIEKRLGQVESDVVDLSNGQKDLTKRVEELTAFVEVRAKSGEVNTKAVKVSETGTTTFKLNAGERIIAIDGVPVQSLSSSGGGSSGSFTQQTVQAAYGSAPPVASSGGSNGSLSYSPPPVTYQTQTYTASTVSGPAGTTVNMAPRQPLLNGPLKNGGLRSNGGLFQRRSAPQAPATCSGPNCPN